MTVLVRDILAQINETAPFSLAENWDNCGLQAGNPDWPVQKILVCLDVNKGAVTAAQKLQCDLIVSHHPLMMASEKSMDFSRMPGWAVAMAAKHNIAIVSAHTNLDKAQNGLNDYFASKLDIQCTGPFYTEVNEDPSALTAGLGRLGTIASPLSLEQLAQEIKERLDMAGVRVIGNLEDQVEKVALCTGSGGSLTDHFLQSTAQVYITGDLKYHEARDIEAGGKAAIDVGHFASEIIVTELFCQLLAPCAEGDNIEIFEFKTDEDPFIII